MEEACSHIDAIQGIKMPQERVCVDCVKAGGTWVHLRTCQECGETRCCDSSPGKHASGHFKITQHPVIISAEKGERWIWCYKDQSLASY